MLGVHCLVAGTGLHGRARVRARLRSGRRRRLWDAMLERGVAPCGLGARDTLRLEVCYPLHGNDISPERTPIEAGLGWACALDKDFTGVEVLRRQKEEGPREKLVAVRHGGEGDPAAGDADRGGRRGHVGHAVADARPGHRPRATCRRRSPSPDTQLTIDVRGRPRGARVVKKPIYRREES